MSMFHREKKPLPLLKVVPGKKIVINRDGTCGDFDPATNVFLGSGDGTGNVMVTKLPDGRLIIDSHLNECGKDARHRKGNRCLLGPEQTRVLLHILYTTQK